MKIKNKIIGLLLLSGAIFSTCVYGAEFATEAGVETAQNALTKEEIAIMEEQASQRRLAEKMAEIKKELEERELIRAQRQASTQLQRATERSKKASEELRTAVSKIGSGQIEQESAEHVQSIIRPTSEERLGYLAQLPAERIVDLAYHLADINRPLESLKDIQEYRTSTNIADWRQLTLPVFLT